MSFGILLEKINRLCKQPLFLIIYILLPALLTMLVGSMFQDIKDNGKIPIAIVDLDNGEYSKLIIERMKGKKRIEIFEFSRSDAMQALERGEIDSVFIIKEQFSQRLVAENREAIIELWTSPLSMATAVVQEMVASETTRLSSHIKAANWVVDYLSARRSLSLQAEQELWRSAFNYSDNQWIPKPLMTIDYQESRSTMKKVDVTANNNSFLGFWMFFTMLFSFLLTESLLKERQSLFKRMLGTYFSVRAYIIQSGIAYFLIMVVQAIVSFMIMKQSLNVNIADIWIELLVFLFICLTISMTMALQIKSSGLYYCAGIFITLLINLVGSSFFYKEEFPSLFTRIAGFLPQHWLLTGGANSVQIIVMILLLIVISLVSIWRLERFYD